VVWASPGEFGQPAATDTRNGAVAPLLAGFSIALLATVGQAPTGFRWPGATILLLLCAAGLFVLSIQLGFRSRSLLYSREDALSWGRINDLPEELDERVRAEIQRRHMALWRRSQRSVQLSYNGAVATLALAVSCVAAPPQAYGSQALDTPEQVWRWAASLLGITLTALQTGWIVRDEYIRRRALRSGATAP
jgi:hypothetical protein